MAQELNLESNLPNKSLRRDHMNYTHVTYVNHSIALMLSQNWSGALLFVERYFTSLNAEASEYLGEKYIRLVGSYFAELVNYINSNKLLGEESVGARLSVETLEKIKEWQ